jgi:hypothetical protein
VAGNFKATVDDEDQSRLPYTVAKITAQPVNQVGLIGGDAVFTFSWQALIPAVFTFRWQVGRFVFPVGYLWSDLVESPGAYEGTTTETLTVKNIDSYLAELGPKTYRCRLLFSGAVPTFTDPASLSVPYFVSLFQTPYAAAAALKGTACSVSRLGNAVNPVGFAGPYTYLWSKISGANFTLSTPATDQIPFWSFNASGATGIFESVWQCVISNGTVSVSSGPLYLYATFTDSGAILPSYGQTTPFVQGFGGALTANNPSFVFGTDWSILRNVNLRQPAGQVTFTANSPSAVATLFTQSGVTNPGAFCLGWAQALTAGATAWRTCTGAVQAFPPT